MSADNVRWSLWNGSREVACILRPLTEGSEIATIYYAGLPLGTHICLNDSEAWQWANEHRARWEAQGWKARAEVTGP
jgi:hypothetical protein